MVSTPDGKSCWVAMPQPGAPASLAAGDDVAPGLVGYNSVFVQLYQAYEQVGQPRGAGGRQVGGLSSYSTLGV